MKSERVLRISCPGKIYLFRSSHQMCSVKKGVLKNFTKFTGKHLCQSLFFNKIVGLRPATLLKKILWHRCFPLNFAKFLGTFFYRTPRDDCFCLFKVNDGNTIKIAAADMGYFARSNFFGSLVHKKNFALR